MAEQKVTVVARLCAKKNKEQQVKEALVKLLAPTRAEPGCLNYDLHESVEKAQEFLFHENWTSREALDRHLESAHVQGFLKQAEELLAEPPEITLWRQIG